MIILQITNAVSTIALSNAGTGYSSAPTVSFTGGGGSGAAATTTITASIETITWDLENRPASITGGTSFVYDGDSNRVEETSGGQTTLYINKYYEKNLATGVVTTYYYLGGTLVAQNTGSTLKYISQDNLGSTSTMTTATGTLDSTVSYFPFGTARAGSVNSEKQFTGQILDSTGLYYYNARYYDPTIGRFISADTEVQSYGNPQMFNRYSYCSNNPLNRTDPTGHINVADDGESGYVLAHPTRTGFIVRLFDIFTHPKDWVIEQGINTITAPAGVKVDIVPSIVDKNDIPESQQAAYNWGQTMADVTVQTGIAVGTGCLASSCSSLPAATSDISFNWLDRGSTGRMVANNPAEQAAWDEVMKDPLNNARQLDIKLGDPKWNYSEGWVKMARNVNGVEIHFNYNPILDAYDDFKFPIMKGGAR